jgi:hypothetical protein
MNAPVQMGIGAFLLVFGFLFALFSGSFVDALYSGSFYSNYQVATAYSELVGLVMAALGASLLAYGHGMISKSPAQSQQSP